MSEFRTHNDGYEAVKELEDRVNNLIEEHGITPNNCCAWMAFARTLKTDCKIIYEEAVRLFKENFPEEQEGE